MKRFTFAMIVLMFVMAVPMLAAAMDHSSHDKEMSKEMNHEGHGMKMDEAKEMDHDMHKGHDMGAKDGAFVEIGKDAQAGVIATAKIKAYDEKTMATMAKMGMSATHHVMVFFADEKSGDAIVAGKAALKIKGTDAKPAMLMQMGKGFGADVSVTEMMTTFEVGTKLEDGKKRQFSFMFHNM